LVKGNTPPVSNDPAARPLPNAAAQPPATTIPNPNPPGALAPSTVVGDDDDFLLTEEQLRAAASQTEIGERWAAAMDQGGGASAEEREEDEFYSRPVGEDYGGQEVSYAAGRNHPTEPVLLARAGDAEASGREVVALDRAHLMSDAPKSGEEGGAPLNEPTTEKHNPEAPWPGPESSLAASPTPSPVAGPEPTVQHEPPQPIEFRHKPEAAAGLTGPGPEEQRQRIQLIGTAANERHPEMGPAERAATGEYLLRERERHLALMKAQERDPGRGPRSDTSIPRDEAGQISIDHMATQALAGIGRVYRGLTGELPAPHRIQLALQQAARKVMSHQWWEIYAEHFHPAAQAPQQQQSSQPATGSDGLLDLD
jgi:hypothetical protein